MRQPDNDRIPQPHLAAVTSTTEIKSSNATETRHIADPRWEEAHLEDPERWDGMS